MKEKNPHAHRLLNDWSRILTLPVDEIISAMLDPDLHGRELRKVTPFAGVLSDEDRLKIYKEFARRDIAA